jgi:predicted exporter
MRRARLLAWAIWLPAVGLAALLVARARYSSDLSAFLPRSPSATQRLLIEQLQSGLAARLILIGIEGADASGRAQISRTLAASLRQQGAFAAVDNGEAADAQRDREFLFAHRYALSDAVTPERFSVAGLRSAIGASLELLAAPAGLMSPELLRSDPTGEMLQLAQQLEPHGSARHENGVWSSPDTQRALLLAETRAAGSDTDAQAQALQLVRSDFAAATAPARLAGPPPRLILSGPAVFAVTARATIQREAVRLSLWSTGLIVTLLLLVYRSPTTLLLGLLPVASGALAGIAAVAIGAGVVHGITLGFGITLIGESVDYSIYLFIQSHRGVAAALEPPRRLWQTIGVGVLTSVCGFASLLPSSFPGLSQLGLYSVTGLIVAAAVTRLVLPQLLPRRLQIRDLAPFGRLAAHLLARARTPGVGLGLALLGALCGAVLYAHRTTLWNRDLASLSPVSATAQALDAQLRRELGAPDVSSVIVLSGPDQESVLQRAESVSQQLEPLVTAGVIGGYESPARYLPSDRLQALRRASLPDGAQLRARVATATADLPVRAAALEDFIQQLTAARAAPPLSRQSLQQTSMGLAVDSLLWQHQGQWHALLPLRAATASGPARDIDLAAVRAALAPDPAGRVQALNLKQESDALYSGYLREAARLALAGFGAIVVLLLAVLRSPARVWRVIAPLALAVLVVSAGLIATGTRLGILHLIGLLLIVAVGSNYALFFDRSAVDPEPAELPLTLASVLFANACTVIAFGVLAGSQVPVLSALGGTVAPGAALAVLAQAGPSTVPSSQS